MALQGRVCIVTGASRGIGKGIAVQLGEAGATVYITGRTLKSTDGRFGSLEDTAQEITKRGGRGIAVQCDHKNQADVKKLFDRVKEEQSGRLDLLVNNAYSAVNTLFSSGNKKFYELPVELWDEVNDVGLRNHYFCTWYAAQLMVPRKQGLIVMVSSPGGVYYALGVAYGVGKEGLDRMAADCAVELKKSNVACVSLWPGSVHTEIVTDMLKSPGVPEVTKKMFEKPETAEFSGKAVVELLKDSQVLKKSGKTLLTADLADVYGFKDINGNRPLSLRSLKRTSRFLGLQKLSWIFPSWLKMPGWLISAFTSRL